MLWKEVSPITKNHKETIEFGVGKPSIISHSEIASMPTLPFEYSPNDNQTLIKFVLVHTLPSINSRGRAISYPTQRNSIQSIHYNPVNFEHVMKTNPGVYDDDLILGFMRWASIEDVAGLPVIPNTPIPTEVYAVLWNRVELVDQIIREVETGFISWRVSMEVSANRTEDDILVGSTFTPLSEADETLRSKIGPDSTGSINGEKVALVLGGRRGFIDYWGAALTMFPSEQINPEIELPELASLSKKRIQIKYPLERRETTKEKENKQNNKERKTMNMDRQKEVAHDRLSPNLQIKTNGGADNMDKESLKKELETQMASLSPALQSVINGSGLTADKAKGVIETFQAELAFKSKEILAEAEKQFSKGFVTVEQKDKEVAAAINTFKEKELPKEVASSLEKAIQEKIPEARKAWDAEQSAIQHRESVISSSNIPLTASRKEKIKGFAFDDEGNKAFEDYVNELKEVATETIKNSKKAQVDSQSHIETASIGSLLNGNSATESDNKEVSVASFFK